MCYRFRVLQLIIQAIDSDVCNYYQVFFSLQVFLYGTESSAIDVLE